MGNGLELAYLSKQKLAVFLWSLHGLRTFTLPFSTSSTNQAVLYTSISALPSCVPSFFHFLFLLFSRPVNVTEWRRTDILSRDSIRWPIHLANADLYRKPCARVPPEHKHEPMPQRSHSTTQHVWNEHNFRMNILRTLPPPHTSTPPL